MGEEPKRQRESLALYKSVSTLWRLANMRFIVTKNLQYKYVDRRYHTANEEAVEIQFNFLVRIYVFPEIKLRSLVISKTEL